MMGHGILLIGSLDAAQIQPNLPRILIEKV